MFSKSNFLKLLNTLVLSKKPSLIVVFFFAAAILVFAPAIYRPSIFQAGGDIYHNLWIWGRNVSNVMAGTVPYAPNIFFPDVMSSFYSEMEVGNSLLYGLFSALGLHPIRSYLVIVILAFALTGIMVALISCRLGASTTTAVLGGTIAAFASYRYPHLVHIQLLATYWMLIPLYFSLLYLLDGKRRDLVLTGIAHLPIFCGPSYNLIGLFLLESGIFLSFVFNGTHSGSVRWRRAGALMLAVTFAVLLTIPFWRGYLELFAQGLNRDHTLAPHSNDLLSFFTPPHGSLIYNYAANWLDVQHQLSPNAFFIGFVALALVVITLFRRSPEINAMPDGTRESYRYLRALLWVGIVMLALSLGDVVLWHKLYIMPNLIFIIAEKIHILSATRYIAHYAYFALVAFSIVAACRVSMVPANLKKKYQPTLHILLAILIILENFVVYAPNLSALPVKLSEPPHVYTELAKLPSGKGFVILPLPTSPTRVTYQRQFEYMFYAKYHRLKMFNGVSGFFPLHYTKGVNYLAEFPNLSGLKFAINNNIEYVVNDKHSGRMLDFSKDKMELLCGALSSLYSDNDFEVFKVDRDRGTECITKAGSNALAQWIFLSSSATPHLIGQFNISTMAMTSSLGEQGALAFGPYIVLEKGKYRSWFTIRSAAKQEGIEVGSVDVNASSDQIPSKLYKKTPVYSGTGDQKIQIEFEVIDPSLKHEFRVWSNGQGTIELYRVDLEEF